jgi:flagellar biosynthesis chaperone FliJ
LSAQFQYRLQVLLDRKAREQEEAERALGAAHAGLRLQRERLEQEKRIQEEIALRRDTARRPAAGGTISSQSMGCHADYLRGLEFDLNQAKDAVYAQVYAVEEAEEKVEQARAALAEATRQADVLRKHREKAESRWRRAQERMEALEQEEIGAVLHEARRRLS